MQALPLSGRNREGVVLNIPEVLFLHNNGVNDKAAVMLTFQMKYARVAYFKAFSL